MPKKYKVELGPGVAEQFDELLKTGTPEEIAQVQAAMDELAQAAENGTIDEISEPVDMEKLAQEDPEMAELLRSRIGDVKRQARIENELSEATAYFEQARFDEEAPEEIRENFDIIYYWLVELAELRQLTRGRCEACGEKLVAVCSDPGCSKCGDHVKLDKPDTLKLC